MGIVTDRRSPGTAEGVIDAPPVNALDAAGWFELADAVLEAGRDPATRVVVLRAEGRGFCAGVDIKEIQAKGDEALVGGNRGGAAGGGAGGRGALRSCVRLRGPGGRRRARLLPRRRHRPRRERRRRDRLR